MFVEQNVQCTKLGFCVHRSNDGLLMCEMHCKGFRATAQCYCFRECNDNVLVCDECNVGNSSLKDGNMANGFVAEDNCRGLVAQMSFLKKDTCFSFETFFTV